MHCLRAASVSDPSFSSSVIGRLSLMNASLEQITKAITSANCRSLVFGNSGGLKLVKEDVKNHTCN